MPDTYSNSLKLQPFQLKLTFFDDKFAAIKYEDELTLAELADVITTTTRRSKAQLPWLKLATFGDRASAKNCLRTNDNLLTITGVEVDYDGGATTFDMAVERLTAVGIRALVYTSASYVRGVKEKWRVLCPLGDPHPPAARDELVSWLNGVLGGGIDPASFNRSIAFYYGSVNDNPQHRVELVEGDFIDQRGDLAAGAIGKPGRTGKTGKATGSAGEAPAYSDEEIEAKLQLSQLVSPLTGTGHWWNEIREVVASLVSKRWTDHDIHVRIEPFAMGYGDHEVQKFIDTAREKYGVMDPDQREGLYAAVGAIVAEASKGEPLEPDWRERYVLTQRPKASLHNARLGIEALGIHCSEDVFHNQLWMGRSPAAAPSEPLLPFMGLVTDATIGAVRMLLSDRFGLDFTEKHIRDIVNILCRENAFNPVADMLAEAERTWDGVERLDRMAVDYFNTADTPLDRQFVRKTMIAAVARVRQPGCKFDTILVMEAPEGLNKSSAWAVLAGEGNFSDEPIIGKHGKEVQEQLAGTWIHESADLAGLSKRDVEAVKAFASRQVDRARPAYGHYLVEQPRHSIEVATTNGDRYLQSQTGNRRFWPIKVNAEIDLAKLRAHRLQLWGEAAYWQSQGESLVLDRGLWAAAGVAQEYRRVEDPWEAKIAAMTFMAVADTPIGYIGNGVVHREGGEHRVATAAIFEHVLEMPTGQQQRHHATRLAEVMRVSGWKSGLFKLDGKPVRGYTKVL